MKRLVSILAFSTAALAGAQDAPPRVEGALSLSEAVRRAQSNSPLILAARAEVEAARQGTRAAQARRMPQVSANGFATSTRPGAILAGAPEAMPQMFMGLPPGQTAVANLMLMVPLFTGGALEARVRSATAQERVALGDLAEMAGDTGLMVREAYLMVLLARENVKREEARVTASQEMVRTSQARFEAGKDIEATVQRAEAERAMARREWVMAQNEEAKAMLSLKAAMGIDFDSPISLGEPLALAPVPESLAEVIRLGKLRRGRLTASRARVDAARAEVRGAEGGLRPQVYGSAMADAASDRMMNGGTVGLTVSFPLFDAGERRADVRRMRAMQARAEGLLRQEELNVERDIRQAWLDVRTAAENARSAETSVVSAQAAYEIVRLRVEAGKGILLEQLDALQALSRARADLARATYDQALALAKLDRASGGGA
ncbi:MAG: TolC family protein [Fimbriimonas sp.]